METGPSTALIDAVQRVETALGDIATMGLSWAAPEELGGLLDAGPKLRAMLDAQLCQALAQAERTDLPQRRGLRTVGQLQADRTGADPKKVGIDLRLGRWIVDFVLLRQAWETGQILREHLELIKRTIDTSRTRFALVRDQQLFIDWVTDYDFSDYQQCCRYWMLANDPDGEEPKDQLTKTFFRARERADGMVKLDGLLDPLAGHAFLAAHGAEDQKLFREQTADASSVELDEATRNTRSTGQRGATALMNLVTRGASRSETTAADPLINIVMSETVAEDLLNRLDEPSYEPFPISFDDIDARCETITGTPLHPNLVLAAMATATFRRQIMTATGRTVDVSLNARCFSPWQKQALAVQARGSCQTPGCDAPFTWLEADHITAHSRGGPTQLHNGQLLCGPDNKHKRYKPAA